MFVYEDSTFVMCCAKNSFQSSFMLSWVKQKTTNDCPEGPSEKQWFAGGLVVAEY